MTGSDPDIGAAIATAESGRDLHVLNNTPATGDYSVGAWQINYYGSLRASRTAQFGSPEQLAKGGVGPQAEACVAIHSGSGWSAWSTYNSGAYKQYLRGGGGGSGGGGTGSSSQPTVQEGDSGAAVTTLQLDLDDLGAKLTADGVFGPLTLTAVKSFQGKHGLTQDGIVGPLTWAAIYAAIGKSTPPLPNPGPPSAPPPPSEPAAGISGPALSAWSNLQTTTGPGANATLVKLAGYRNVITGSKT